MKKIHELHNHPMTEYRENIPRDKVFIDKEFYTYEIELWKVEALINFSDGLFTKNKHAK